MGRSLRKNGLKNPENPKEMRAKEQRSASLEQDAQQPRLAMEADVTADMKTRDRTEGAAAAVQAKHGNSCSAKRVQADPISSTSFGVKAEPTALLCRDNVLVESGAATPKSCLSSLEMCTSTAAGCPYKCVGYGDLPAFTVSTFLDQSCRDIYLWAESRRTLGGRCSAPTLSLSLSLSSLFLTYPLINVLNKTLLLHCER